MSSSAAFCSDGAYVHRPKIIQWGAATVRKRGVSPEVMILIAKDGLERKLCLRHRRPLEAVYDGMERV